MTKSFRECLLIDDDQDDQEIFMMGVRSLGANVHCQFESDPVKALTRLKTDDGYVPDYIFIDINMPKINGLECLKGLKSIGRLLDTRMFMYSTSPESRIMEEAMTLGAAGFLMKPVRLADLKEKLLAIFQTSK